MKVVAYTRVSTDKQADHGSGLEIQAEQIRRWCQQNGHRLVGHHEDAGQSGTLGVDRRLALADALHDCATRKARGIVVARLDRLARDLIVQETLIAEAGKSGARIFSCNDTENAYLDDPALDQDPSRTLVRQMFGAIAQYERAMIRMRMDAGKARKISEGGYAHGAPPYGYRAHDGELVPVPAELDAIAMMRAMRAAGGSWRQICAHLEAAGVPTAKGGTTWHSNTVRRIVERPDELEETTPA